jgi:hypothetical protein
LLGFERPVDGEPESEERHHDRELAELNAGIEPENARRTPRPADLHLRKRSGEAEAVNEPARENDRATHRDRAGQSGPAVPQICRGGTDYRGGNERLYEHRRNSGETADPGQREHKRDAMSRRKGRKNAKYRTEGARSACNAEKNREQKKEVIEPTANVGEAELKKVEKQVVLGAKEGVRRRRRPQNRRFVLRVRTSFPSRGANGELPLIVGRSKQICFDANIDRFDGKIGLK